MRIGGIGDVELEPFDFGDRPWARPDFAHAINVIVSSRGGIGKALDARVIDVEQLGRAQLRGGIVAAAASHVAVVKPEPNRRAEAAGRRVVGLEGKNGARVVRKGA